MGACGPAPHAPLQLRGVWHKVTADDTLDAVAEKYNTQADAIAELVSDMHDCAESIPVPAGLAERVIRRVPPPRPIRVAPRGGFMALQRAAAWAIVFLGAWWQLVGANISGRAADEFGPVAGQLIADVRQAAAYGDDATGDGNPVLEEAGSMLAGYGRQVTTALFGAQPGPATPEQPQTQPMETKP